MHHLAALSVAASLSIVHVAQGCHVWGTADSVALGPAKTLVVKHGSAVKIRVNCSMDFRFAQVAGPKVALGDALTHAGTVRTILFPKAGVYRFRAVNVESSADMGLQTLGPDNVLVLTVRAK